MASSQLPPCSVVMRQQRAARHIQRSARRCRSARSTTASWWKSCAVLHAARRSSGTLEHGEELLLEIAPFGNQFIDRNAGGEKYRADLADIMAGDPQVCAALVDLGLHVGSDTCQGL